MEDSLDRASARPPSSAASRSPTSRTPSTRHRIIDRIVQRACTTRAAWRRRLTSAPIGVGDLDPRPRHPRPRRCPGDRGARLGRRPGDRRRPRRCPRTSPCGCTTSRWPWSTRTSAAPASARPCRCRAGASTGTRLLAHLGRRVGASGWPGRSSSAPATRARHSGAMARMRGIADRVEQLLGQAVVATTPVAGGDICTSTRVRLSSGASVLVKTRASAPDGLLRDRGARAALAGRAGRGRRAPRCSRSRRTAWCSTGSSRRGRPPRRPPTSAARSPGCTPAVPTSSAPTHDGFIASLPLPNKTAPTWPEFYADRRILPYLKLASDRGHVERADVLADRGRWSAGSPTSPVPTSRPPGSTATCGPATWCGPPSTAP